MHQEMSHTNAEITEIYGRHVNTVWNLCMTYLKNIADTEDAVQEVFLRLMTSDVVFQSSEHEKAWLIVVTQNVCKNQLRHPWRKNITLTYQQRALEEMPEIDETLSAVRSLSDRYKTILYLYYYEGYSTEDIAKLLNKPAATIRSRLHRGRSLLRKKLGELNET